MEAEEKAPPRGTAERAQNERKEDYRNRGDQSTPLSRKAADYMAQGWAVIPMKPRTKEPAHCGWQSVAYRPEELPEAFPDGHNIAAVLGERSRHLVDVDLDSNIAVELAPQFLPQTEARFGRDSRPGSHYLYNAADATYRTFKYPDGWVPKDEQMMLEIRAGGGRQVMLPPSVHPSGEAVRWDEQGGPAAVEADVLEAACEKLAQACRHLLAIRKAIEHIDPDCAYDDWIRIGMALHSWSEQLGLAEWDRWSAPGTKYKPGELQKLWNGFGKPRDGKTVALGTLFWLARQQGWEGLPNLKDACGEEASDDWPEITFGRVEFTPLPPFPIECLPPEAAEMAKSISQMAKVPLEMAALTVLSVVGLACGRNIVASPKRGITARPNLFVLVFSATGTRKSTAFEPAVHPVHEWTQRRLNEWRRFKDQRDIREERGQRLVSAIASTKTNEADRSKYQVELTKVRQEQDRDLMRSPFLLCETVTPEAMIKNMAETGGSMGLYSDDARMTFDILFGRYAKGDTQEGVLLKAYDGTSPIIDSRIGRGTTMVEQPFASVLLLVQVDYLRKLAERPEMEASGFMSRCQFCVPDDWCGAVDESGRLRREWDEEVVPEDVRTSYSVMIHRLLEAAYTRTEVQTIPLSADAKSLWVDFFNNCERALGPEGEYANRKHFATRYPTHALRLALQCAACASEMEISGQTMLNAIMLVIYMDHHVVRARQVMTSCSLPEPERRILAHIRKRRLGRLSVRNAQHATGIKSADETAAAFKTLARLGFCRALPARKGKSSLEYEINPATHEMEDRHEYAE